MGKNGVFGGGLRAWTGRSSDKYRYAALPSDYKDGNGSRNELPWAERRSRILKAGMAALILVAILYFLSGYVFLSKGTSCDSVKDGFHCKESISNYWGQYSPFYRVDSDIGRGIPRGCNVTFAQILSRHGARDPTLSKALIYGALVARIQQSVTAYGRHYHFLKTFNYTLGVDQLTGFGGQEMVNSGIKFYKRYADLAQNEIPFVRSSGQQRVMESAQNWTQGFYGTRIADRTGISHERHDDPYEMVVIPEVPGFNNTLSHSLCPAFEKGESEEDKAQGSWKDIFAPPITKRLNKNLPGANLTDNDTISFMGLCPFTTVADDFGRLTPFCHLFSAQEWYDYDYYETLGKWYGYANGNPLGATQGVGWVNELVARLTQTPVHDNTSTNSTLDADFETFPLDRALYADFSHDNDMSSIYAALGLFNSTPPLDMTSRMSREDTKGYSASWTVPFGARMYVEKLMCEDTQGDEEMVRILVNDRVIPLEGCRSDELGRCSLSSFVESLSFARQGGFWDRCFG